MVMSVPKAVRRFRLRVHPVRGGRGFSLVELLVVIAILAIVFIVGGMQVTKAWQRQKLQSASADIKILMQRALPEMQRRGMATFVRVGPLVTAGAVRYLPIYLIGDANANGAVDAFANPPTVAAPDLLIDEYDIMVVGQTGVKGTTGVTQEFCLSDADITQIQSTLWSDNTTNWTNGRTLMCDFQGRAIDIASGLQIAGPATLVLTHVNMVVGDLLPRTRYVLSINPVWSVRIRKQVQDATSTWVDQSGG